MPTNIPDAIIVGYTTIVRDPATARNHLEIKPPGNLKKPESIEAWRNDEEKQKLAWANLDALAPWTKLTGALSCVHAVNLHKEQLFNSSSYEDVEPGTAFVQWLTESYHFPHTPGDADYPVIIYGFDPKPLLRLAGMAAVRDGVRVPLGLWYSSYDNHCLDPKEMLLESEVKKLYPLAKICDEAPGGPILLPANYRPHINANLDMRVAVEICLRYGLLPTRGDQKLQQLVTHNSEMGWREPTAEEDEEAPAEEVAEEESAPVEKKPVKKKSTKKKPATAKK